MEFLSEGDQLAWSKLEHAQHGLKGGRQDSPE